MTTILTILTKQRAKLGIFTRNAKKLITANFLFGLFNPFYLIFSNTFIFSFSKGNLEMNLLYCIFTFAGLISGFVINGFLSRQFQLKKLMISGVWVMFLTLVLMFSMPLEYINSGWIIFFGFFTGAGSGIYWASRNYLTLVVTNDKNRDFFSGIDYIFISAGRIITPFLVGAYIGHGIKAGWFTPGVAYRSTLILAFVLTLVVTIITMRVKAGTVRFGKFLYLKYAKQWQKVRLLFITLGIFQGTIFVVPSVFIMKFIGGESSVGTINSVGYIIAIVLLYIVSSRSGTEHRTRIIRWGFLLFCTGAVFFSLFLPRNASLGTYILIFLMFLTEPILNFPVRATLLKAIDAIRLVEKREGYSYLVDVEAFSNIGRIGSLLLFYLLYQILPSAPSMILYILSMAGVQYLCIPLSRSINGS